MKRIEERLPAVPGSYLLWLYLRRGTTVEVGRLGDCYFQRGWYFYCGSAYGPGGLRARLRHHLRLVVRPHWHIDYLRQSAELRAIWLCRGSNLEHLWSRLLARYCGAVEPLPGFGSSDCSCHSHLAYLPKRPAATELKDGIAGDQRISCLRLAGSGKKPATWADRAAHPG